MALNSPIISDQDSLIEEAPLQDIDEKKRGTVAYSTYTRKRPENLPNNLQKKKRQSLMSPQSIPNLDSDGLITPDFTMTQSMYEPTEKKKQQQKLDANSKLLNLIASEKSARAAQERKRKEMNKRLNENRKRNEEKQRLVEERRLRIIADQDAKMQKILNRISSTGPMTASYYGNNSNKNVAKYKNPMGSGFLDKRPVSSTGKIFGFGSSAPRIVCEKLNMKRLKRKTVGFPEVQKPETNVSKMCASQIVSNVSYEKEPKSKIQMRSTKVNSVKPMSVSAFNISKSNRNLAKSNEVTDALSNNKLNRRPKNLGVTDIKSSVSQNSIKDLSNSTKKSQIKKKTPKSRDHSTDLYKSTPNIQLNHEQRSSTLERKKHPVEQKVTEPTTKPHTSKLRTKRELPKLIKPKSEHSTSGIDKINENQTICSPRTGEMDNLRRPEVRFEEKDEDVSIVSQSSISIDRHRSSTCNLTEDEYKQRISLQRRLAKEKKRKEQEERERIAAQQQEELKLMEVNNDPQLEDPVDRQESFRTPKVLVDDIQNNSASPPLKDISDDNEMKAEIRFNEIQDTINLSTNISGVSGVSGDSISESNLLKSEVSDSNVEIAASTEALDRKERRKRLDSIMSRIKKPVGGSTENVTQPLKTTTLQDMLEKGHLSGMSKTAAILMKNSSQTSELSSSASELHSQVNSQKSPPCADLSFNNSIASEKPNDTEQVRGSCDGQEDVQVHNEVPPMVGTKSDLIGNLTSNTNKPYLSTWQDKYSNSYSLDAEDE